MTPLAESSAPRRSPISIASPRSTPPRAVWSGASCSIACSTRADTRAWLDAGEQGFVMARRGRRATHVGPLVAENGRQAVALLGAALASSSGPVYVDVPAARQETVDWLERRGFRRQRSFVRMSLGAAFPPEIDERAYVLVGPEFG